MTSLQYQVQIWQRVQSSAQVGFDQLNAPYASGSKNQNTTSRSLGRVDELKLDKRYQEDSGTSSPAELISESIPLPSKRMRKEQSVLPEPEIPTADERELSDQQPPKIRIRTFESEIDPFEVSLLDSGQFVLFRKVWRDGQRYIQGALIEQKPLLDALIETPFDETSLSQMSDLVLAYQGSVISVFSRQADREISIECERHCRGLAAQDASFSPIQ